MLRSVKPFKWYILANAMVTLIASVVIFINPFSAALGFTLVTASVMLLKGILSICSFISDRSLMQMPTLSLIDGILSLILSLFTFVCGPSLDLNILLYMFSSWLLFAGISRLSTCLSLYRQKNPPSIWLLLAGVIFVLLGVVFLTNPLVALLAFKLWFGIFFVTTAAVSLVEFFLV